MPDLPFPGRRWHAATRCGYQRFTTAGTTWASVAEDRPNEQVLVGKRVFTDRFVYRGGDRVRVCAELWTPPESETTDRFVVAHCFPTAAPGRITRRVLVPERAAYLGHRLHRIAPPDCAHTDRVLQEHREPRCIGGFEAQVPEVSRMVFPIVAAPFRLWSEALATDVSGSALRIPDEGVSVACPPSTTVDLTVRPGDSTVTATAYSANGTAADTATAGPGGAAPEALLHLEGPEIVRIFIEQAGGEARLAGICVDKPPLATEAHKARSQWYTGTFDFAQQEPAGTWTVVMMVQMVNDSPAGGDPLDAARRLGGIVESANVAEMGECACSILFDHTFDLVSHVALVPL